MSGEIVGHKASYESITLSLQEMLDMPHINKVRVDAKRGWTWNEKQKQYFIRYCLNGGFPGNAIILRVPNAGGEEQFYFIDFAKRFQSLQQFESNPNDMFYTLDEIIMSICSFISSSFNRALNVDEVKKVKKLCLEYINETKDDGMFHPAVIWSRVRNALDICYDREAPCETEEEKEEHRQIMTKHNDALKAFLRLDDVFDDMSSLSEMQIPVIIFDNMTEALLAYSSMFPGTIRETDLWKIAWGNQQIDIARCEEKDALLNGLDGYYSQLKKQVKHNLTIERWSGKTAFYGKTYDNITKTFEYDEDTLLPDEEGHVYITLYELCCALAYIFYESAPRFAISDNDDDYMIEWKSSYLGFIMLSIIFGEILHEQDDIERFTRIVPFLDDPKTLDSIVEVIRNEASAIGENYDKHVFGPCPARYSYYTNSYAPPKEVFTPFLEVIFYQLWHNRYELIKEDDKHAIIKNRQDLSQYERVKELIPVLLFKMLVTNYITPKVKLLNPILQYDYHRYVQEEPSVDFIDDMSDWTKIEQLFEDYYTTHEKKNRPINIQGANRIEQVIYAMFMSLFVNNDNSEMFIEDGIFEKRVVDSCLEEGWMISKGQSTQFGNLLFIPYREDTKDKDNNIQLKGNVSLREQIKDMHGLLDEKQLDELMYPMTTSNDGKRAETFDYIRVNLLKDRPSSFFKFTKKREQYIWKTLFEKIKELSE